MRRTGTGPLPAGVTLPVYRLYGALRRSRGVPALAGSGRLSFTSAPPGGTIHRSADHEQTEGREQG